MPRTTYNDRFDNLLAKDYLAPRDRTFIESLYTYYKSKKSLTAGRRHHFVRLEKQYENPPVVDVAAQRELPELGKLKQRAAVCHDVWSVGFLDSIENQMKTGKSLTPRQQETFDSLKERFSDEAMEEMQNWKELWNEEKALKFKVCVGFYKYQGRYFTKTLSKIAINPDYIPTVGEYNQIVKNKYAKKVLDGYFAEAKFQRGELVSRTSNWSQGVTWVNGKAKPQPEIMMVLRVNHDSPKYSCKGNKLYEVMDVNTHDKYICSERDLKKLKKKTKKSS